MRKLSIMEQVEFDASDWYNRETSTCELTKEPCDYKDCSGVARPGWCPGCCRAG